MTTRTETALSERELAAIEARHPLDRQADADYRYMGTDAYHVGCDAARLLAALTAERAARGQVEAAALRFAQHIERLPVGFGDWACVDCHADNSHMLVAGFRCIVHEARHFVLLSPSTTTPEAEQ